MPINPECEQFNFRSLDKLFGIQARRRGVDALENKYREPNGVEKQQPFQAILLNTSFAIKNVMNCLLARFYIGTITAWISYRVLTCLSIL